MSTFRYSCVSGYCGGPINLSSIEWIFIILMVCGELYHKVVILSAACGIWTNRRIAFMWRSASKKFIYKFSCVYNGKHNKNRVTQYSRTPNIRPRFIWSPLSPVTTWKSKTCFLRLGSFILYSLFNSGCSLMGNVK